MKYLALQTHLELLMLQNRFYKDDNRFERIVNFCFEHGEGDYHKVIELLYDRVKSDGYNIQHHVNQVELLTDEVGDYLYSTYGINKCFDYKSVIDDNGNVKV